MEKEFAMSKTLQEVFDSLKEEKMTEVTKVSFSDDNVKFEFNTE